MRFLCMFFDLMPSLFMSMCTTVSSLRDLPMAMPMRPRLRMPTPKLPFSSLSTVIIHMRVIRDCGFAPFLVGFGFECYGVFEVVRCLREGVVACLIGRVRRGKLRRRM